jgi:metallo-beta-lactamase class B
MRILTVIIALCFATDTIGQNTHGKLKITHLAGDFYVYTTYNTYQGNRYPANGMYIITSKGAILLDTPWDTTQFQPLLDSIHARHNKKVVLCIATHFHEDRTAGLEFFKQNGSKTYTTQKTDDWSRKRGMKRAEFLILNDTTFNVGQYAFQTYYPGPGHAPDNIVIWFKKEKILYGGCLVKSVEDKTLGNLGDASVKEYATTIRKVRKKFKRPRYIIPGHNDWTNSGSLEHTEKMAKKAMLKK